MVEQIHIEPIDGGVWAVKGDEGYLGFAPNEDTAVRLGRGVAEWLTSHGCAAELRIERSFLRWSEKSDA